MKLTAVGMNDKMELEDNILKIKGASTFKEKEYSLENSKFNIVKFKDAKNRFLGGYFILEIETEGKVKVFNISFNYNERNNFKRILNVLKDGYKED